MRRAILFLLLVLGPPRVASPRLDGPARAQQVVDRIVVRIEDDIITLSEVRELGQFQQLVEGHAASEDRLAVQLIEQWIVSAEATAARFPHPIEAEVDREGERLEKQFPSPQAYQDRLREIGLSPAAVRRQLERELYLSRFLDYKFRPTVQVDTAAVEKYYREQFVPALAAQGGPPPPLDSVEDQIRELLTQGEISQRAARWLEEAKARLRIEREPPNKGS